MDGLELKSFELISSAGMAKSCFLEAIQLAYEHKFEEADKRMEEGNEAFIQGHQSHAGLIQTEAMGDAVSMTLLLTHAEDQMMSAEIIKLMAKELIRLYKKTGDENEANH